MLYAYSITMIILIVFEEPNGVQTGLSTSSLMGSTSVMVLSPRGVPHDSHQKSSDEQPFNNVGWPKLKDKIKAEKVNDIGFKTTDDFIIENQFPVEVHQTITEDGYKLVMFRIPAKEPNAPVLMLQHGLFATSSDWVVGGQTSLAFQLSRAGWDVWLGNTRGNIFSSEHDWLNMITEHHVYWNFTFHEMGIHDLTTNVDYILKITNSKQLDYIGHSMGTTMFYIMCTEREEYNKKVRVMISLAPTAFMGHMSSAALRYMATSLAPFGNLSRTMNIHVFKPMFSYIFHWAQALCRMRSPIQSMCDNLMFLMTGYDIRRMERTSLQTMLSIAPSKVPIKLMFHFTQLVRKKFWFGQYDYGLATNLLRYNSETPPKYELTKITVPIVLMYSENDWMSSFKDVEDLWMLLKRRYKIYRVPVEGFTHMDFMWAMDEKMVVYREIIRILNFINEGKYTFVKDEVVSLEGEEQMLLVDETDE